MKQVRKNKEMGADEKLFLYNDLMKRYRVAKQQKEKRYKDNHLSSASLAKALLAIKQDKDVDKTQESPTAAAAPKGRGGPAHITSKYRVG
jgi:hypothetical protein